MRWSLVLVLAVLTAGCASEAPAQQYQEVREADATAAPIRSGSVVGLVADPALRPIEGATVVVPGMERSVTSDADGRFAFSELPVGAFFLRAEHPGFHPGATEGQVLAGEVVEVRLTLEPAARDPMVQVFEFKGFAPLSDGLGESSCPACTWQFEVGPDAEALVMEMASDRPEGQGNRFQWRLVSGSEVHAQGKSDDPARVLWDEDRMPAHPAMTLEVKPLTLVAAVDVEFEVFVAAFYNGADPDLWGIVGAEA